MSLRIDTSEWLSGALIIGETGLGVLAENIPATGDHGPGYAYNSLSFPADNGKEICGTITAWPTSGALFAYEDTSYEFSGAPDGSYWFEWQLRVDGVAVGSPVRVWLQVGPASAQISATADDTIASFSASVVSGAVSAQILAITDDAVFSGGAIGYLPFTQAQLDYLLSYMQENLMIPTSAENAAAVLSAMQTSPPPVNVKKVNDVPIAGSGVAGDSMRPA